MAEVGGAVLVVVLRHCLWSLSLLLLSYIIVVFIIVTFIVVVVIFVCHCCVIIPPPHHSPLLEAGRRVCVVFLFVTGPILVAIHLVSNGGVAAMLMVLSCCYSKY